METVLQQQEELVFRQPVEVWVEQPQVEVRELSSSQPSTRMNHIEYSTSELADLLYRIYHKFAPITPRDNGT
jgi:hypothetical protein